MQITTTTRDLTAPTFHRLDDEGKLFISPAIREWEPIAALGIDTVFDMDGGLDECIPTTPDGCIYIYFPIYDEELPPLSRLEALGNLGAHLIRSGHGVLSHCGMGFNRSALVAGVILHKLGGMRGPEIVSRIRERRPGALFNDVFAGYLRSL
jgi:protein-tyrosine phosphatase